METLTPDSNELSCHINSRRKCSPLICAAVSNLITKRIFSSFYDLLIFNFRYNYYTINELVFMNPPGVELTALKRDSVDICLYIFISIIVDLFYINGNPIIVIIVECEYHICTQRKNEIATEWIPPKI